MAFFPVFIPVGGGGPPLHPVIGLPLIVIGGYIIYRITDDEPWFRIMMEPEHRIIRLHIERYHGFVDETHVTHKNIECLEKKGYDFEKTMGDNSTIYFKGMYGNISRRNIDIDKETFIADCSECKVSTEVKYKYHTLLLKRKKRGSQTFNWADNYDDPLQ